MIDVAAPFYLLHSTPPEGVGGQPQLFALTPDLEGRKLSLDDLAALKAPIITHSFHYLVEWFRREQRPLPSTVVDLESTEKLCLGIRKGGLRRPYPWQLGQMFLRRLGDDLPESVARGLAHCTLEPIIAGLAREDSVSPCSLSKLVELLPTVWRSLAEELRMDGEWCRFLEIEVPVYNLLLESQYHGLNLDLDRYRETIEGLESEYFSVHRRLTVEQGVDVERALRDIAYRHDLVGVKASKLEAWSSSLEELRVRREVDPLYAELYQVYRLRQDRRILMRATSDTGDQARTHVQFDSMGTVTARVLSVNPRLQNLSRKNRHLLVPSEGYDLSYLDFAQFEPAILASLSGDGPLRRGCSTGDIYGELALAIFGQRDRRTLVKRIFLPYLYGMSIVALVSRVRDLLGGLEVDAESVERHFVELLSTVESWKREICDELAVEGRIGSVKGNFRYRTHFGDLDSRERRWAISQVVQGTGALILKEWMIAISREQPTVHILLPMHDALLLEVPRGSSEDIEAAVKRLGEGAFAKYCPGVPVFLAPKSFAE